MLSVIPVKDVDEAIEFINARYAIRFRAKPRSSSG